MTVAVFACTARAAAPAGCASSPKHNSAAGLIKRYHSLRRAGGGSAVADYCSASSNLIRFVVRFHWPAGRLGRVAAASVVNSTITIMQELFFRV